MEKLAKMAESAAKLIIALSGILYVIGFLVVAFHRSQLSLPAAGLLRTEYVLAGVWALFPFAVVLSLLAFAVAVTKHSSSIEENPQGPPTRTKRVRHLLQVLAYWASLAAVLLAIIARFIPKSYVIAVTKQSFELYNYIFWPLGFAAYFMIAVLVYKRRSMAAIMIIFLAFTGFEYLLWFAHDLYPEIPRSLGGGAPTAITLEGPSPYTTDKHLKLIAEDSDFLYLLSGTDKVRVLRKSTIDSYLIDP